jgi:phosphoglycolate phosphatase
LALALALALGRFWLALFLAMLKVILNTSRLPSALNPIYLNPRAFDAVIIDLDGTMVDTMGDFVAALNLMLADLPTSYASLAPLESALVRQMVGKGSEHLIRTVLARAPNLAATQTAADDSGSAVFELAFASYQKHYATINGRYAEVYPGVLAGLQALQQQGLPMACLTNKPLAFAQELLKEKGLDSFFSAVFGGDSFARKKPDPLPLLETCAALFSLPARTLMLGDSSNDAIAARAAGCPVLLLTYGYNHGESVSLVDADGFMDSMAQLCWRE